MRTNLLIEIADSFAIFTLLLFDMHHLCENCSVIFLTHVLTYSYSYFTSPLWTWQRGIKWCHRYDGIWCWWAHSTEFECLWPMREQAEWRDASLTIPEGWIIIPLFGTRGHYFELFRHIGIERISVKYFIIFTVYSSNFSLKFFSTFLLTLWNHLSKCIISLPIFLLQIISSSDLRLFCVRFPWLVGDNWTGRAQMIVQVIIYSMYTCDDWFIHYFLNHSYEEIWVLYS